MTDKLEALKASARGIARLLGDIASFDSWDIDGDIVDIRFEDENGCDTGADVSITETADKASQAISELLAALEEKDQRIAVLNVKLFDQSILLDAAISRAEASGRREEHLKASVDVLSAKNAELEQRLQQPIKLPKRKSAAEYVDEEFSNADLAAIHNVTILECSVKIKNAGFKVEVEGE